MNSSLPRSCDVLVVGLGAAGSSVLYQLARRGADAVGIDALHPPHDRGSSHGETRITRQAIGEGNAYVPLALRSNEIWEELEAATGEQLLVRCGFLCLTRNDAGTSHHGKSGFLERTRQAAVEFGVQHEMLEADAVRLRFPQFTGLVGDEQAYFEPGGGYLKPEACISAQLQRASGLGARVVTSCMVGSIDRTASSLWVSTALGVIAAKRVVVATGSWVPGQVERRIADRITVHRQVLHWFDVLDPTAYREGATPVFIWTHGSKSQDQFYGFPPLRNQIKVAREDYSGAFDPDGVRAVDEDDGRAMAALHVHGRLAGLADQPSKSQVCHYAVTDDHDFIIDHEVVDERIQVISACSGHGFKHAAAIGESIAQALAGERSAVDLSSFSARRFDPLTAGPEHATPPPW